MDNMVINYQEMNTIAEKKSSKSGQKIDGNANDALGCSKRCWSDRLTMPHDHCFVGSTKKVISSHLRAAAGEDDQGRPREGNTVRNIWHLKPPTIRMKAFHNL